jgi:hypothetical protein
MESVRTSRQESLLAKECMWKKRVIDFISYQFACKSTKKVITLQTKSERNGTGTN